MPKMVLDTSTGMLGTLTDMFDDTDGYIPSGTAALWMTPIEKHSSDQRVVTFDGSAVDLTGHTAPVLNETYFERGGPFFLQRMKGEPNIDSRTGDIYTYNKGVDTTIMGEFMFPDRQKAFLEITQESGFFAWAVTLESKENERIHVSINVIGGGSIGEDVDIGSGEWFHLAAVYESIDANTDRISVVFRNSIILAHDIDHATEPSVISPRIRFGRIEDDYTSDIALYRVQNEAMTPGVIESILGPNERLSKESGDFLSARAYLGPSQRVYYIKLGVEGYSSSSIEKVEVLTAKFLEYETLATFYPVTTYDDFVTLKGYSTKDDLSSTLNRTVRIKIYFKSDIGLKSMLLNYLEVFWDTPWNHVDGSEPIWNRVGNLAISNDETVCSFTAENISFSRGQMLGNFLEPRREDGGASVISGDIQKIQNFRGKNLDRTWKNFKLIERLTKLCTMPPLKGRFYVRESEYERDFVRYDDVYMTSLTFGLSRLMNDVSIEVTTVCSTEELDYENK